MDITPQFTVFLIMVVGMLVEIPLLFALLHALGVRKYGDASLSSVAMWAAGLMLAEFYGGWRLACWLEDEQLVWLVTLPAALLAVAIFVWAYALPVARAVVGGVIFFGLHFWIIPLLPQPKVEGPLMVVVPLSEATDMRLSYRYDDSRPDYVQWYSQLKSWDEVRLLAAPFLEQFESLMMDDSGPVRVELLKMALTGHADKPRMEVIIDGTTPDPKKSSNFKAFLGRIKSLNTDAALFEEVTLDRFGPDLRVGEGHTGNQFELRGYRYLPLPGNHDSMNGLSRNAAQLAVRLYDDWMRPDPAQRLRNKWASARAGRIVSAGNLPVKSYTPLNIVGIPAQGGGCCLNGLAVSIVAVGSYDEIVRTVKQFEADKMTCWVTTLDLHRQSDASGMYECVFDVAWPQWGSRDLDAAVATFLGKKVPPPVYDEPQFDDEAYMRRMQESGGYYPSPYQ